MKTIGILLCLMLIHITGLACELCKKQQPKGLAGITHGAGPDSNWDYVIVASMAIIVLMTLFFSVKWLFNPGERDQHHIKRSIFKS